MALSVVVASLSVGDSLMSLPKADMKTTTQVCPDAIVGRVPGSRSSGLLCVRLFWVIYLLFIRRCTVCESQLSARPALPFPVPHEGEKGGLMDPTHLHLISNVDKKTEWGEQERPAGGLRNYRSDIREQGRTVGDILNLEGMGRLGGTRGPTAGRHFTTYQKSDGIRGAASVRGSHTSLDVLFIIWSSLAGRQPRLLRRLIGRRKYSQFILAATRNQSSSVPHRRFVRTYIEYPLMPPSSRPAQGVGACDSSVSHSGLMRGKRTSTDDFCRLRGKPWFHLNGMNCGHIS